MLLRIDESDDVQLAHRINTIPPNNIEMLDMIVTINSQGVQIWIRKSH